MCEICQRYNKNKTITEVALRIGRLLYQFGVKLGYSAMRKQWNNFQFPFYDVTKSAFAYLTALAKQMSNFYM